MPEAGIISNTSFSREDLNLSVEKAHAALSRVQQQEGYWVYELEADATIPAEYILLEHFIDRINDPLEQKMAVYLRRIQSDVHGGWPLYHDGDFDLSASVKAYFALKAVGDDINAPHMRRAREAILKHGGAERANVFTRFQLALFGDVPWRATPVMPVELMLLPSKAFVSIWDVSYWSRTVIAPLLVLAALRPVAVNSRRVHVRELFVTPPEKITDWIRGPYYSLWGYFFKGVDSVLRLLTPFAPKRTRQKAIQAALDFIEPRLNGRDGLGAIYPAMANVVMMYHALGVADTNPHAAIAWKAVQDLVVEKNDEAYCQPCFSPIWDTGLAGHAVIEAASGPQGLARQETAQNLKKACAWLRNKQILAVKGDWAIRNPTLAPGGWAFQYNNDYYPDVDDTAVVGMLLHREGDPENAESIERARQWIIGMQSSNGGWGAFDIDNNKAILNHIPFADHGALLDPPTADVTARCISFLAQLGNPEDHSVIQRGLNYLRQEQESDGSWFGRWGTNYIYGTWSVLCAFNAAGISYDDPSIVRAVTWLRDRQRPDGSWGEDCDSYKEGGPRGVYYEGLPSQTAWAALGLMAAGLRDDPAVARAVTWLVSQQDEEGAWHEESYNAVGFPRVFYLHYHGYRQYFPLMALARYRNLGLSNTRRVGFGI
ncbi:MAG: squalene--hopene cyclase [Acetobacter sp.]|nr:squalene--hopene cyclase [Acetobacter sp.]